jgi:hypothetical protein
VGCLDWASVVIFYFSEGFWKRVENYMKRGSSASPQQSYSQFPDVLVLTIGVCEL